MGKKRKDPFHDALLEEFGLGELPYDSTVARTYRDNDAASLLYCMVREGDPAVRREAALAFLMRLGTTLTVMNRRDRSLLERVKRLEDRHGTVV